MLVNARTVERRSKRSRTRPKTVQHIDFETEESLAKLKLFVQEFADGFTIGETLQHPIRPFYTDRPS
jgi:hypothetical protein